MNGWMDEREGRLERIHYYPVYFLGACLLAKDSGSCLAKVPSFYYDPSSDSCISFNYGGKSSSSSSYKNQLDSLILFQLISVL